MPDSASGDVLVVDLPAGVVTARVSTPPYPLSVGLSPDGRHLLVFRGRNTDRDWVTVLDSGFSPETGEARPPYVVRTFLGFSPGGVDEGFDAVPCGASRLRGRTTITLQSPTPTSSSATCGWAPSRF